MPSAIWRLMQAIESNRHRADMLESRALTAAAEFRSLFVGLAAQQRGIAQLRYAIAQKQPLPGTLPALGTPAEIAPNQASPVDRETG